MSEAERLALGLVAEAEWLKICTQTDAHWLHKRLIFTGELCDESAAELRRLAARSESNAIDALNYESRIERLQAEVEALRADAERYAYAKTLEGQVVTMETFKNRGAAELDQALDDAMVEEAAIDAARAK